MNTWITCAGVLALLTSLVHIFAGQIDPIRPFLKSDLPDVPKATLLACWHIVSVTLILSGAILFYAGWYSLTEMNQAVIGIAISFISFSFVFIVVGWHFFRYRVLIKLPQWILLLPIGVMGLLGAV